MKRLALVLALALLPGCPGAPGSGGEEQLDLDGDGRIDTWRTSEPDGVVVEQRDTDGDGKPDQTKRLEPLDELPPELEGHDTEPLPEAR